MVAVEPPTRRGGGGSRPMARAGPSGRAWGAATAGARVNMEPEIGRAGVEGSEEETMFEAIETVVIGTSLTELSDDVVRAGLEVARAAGARVCLVHAFQP